MASLLTPNRALFAFLFALSLVPLFAAQFTITLVNYIGLYALVALGLVLLTGIGGLTSFGQAAFVGLGAYATAYLTTRHGMSPWGTLIVGMAITTAVSLALGFITLRLSGHFLPLGTIAWGISLYFIFGNLEAVGRPRRHRRHSGGRPVRPRTRIQPRLLLRDLGHPAGGHHHHPEHARLARRSRHALPAGDDHDRGDGHQHAALPHGAVHDRGPVRLRVRLAVCPPATLRESDALRARPGHRIPVHGRTRRCFRGMGRGVRRHRGELPQGMAAGLAAQAARRHRQLRDGGVRPADHLRAASRTRRHVADHHAFHPAARTGAARGAGAGAAASGHSGAGQRRAAGDQRHQALRRTGRQQSYEPDRAGRRSHGTDRPQWRRQEHAVQLHLGCQSGNRRRDPLHGPAHRTARLARHRQAGHEPQFPARAPQP
jgi:hypothetical protein